MLMHFSQLLESLNIAFQNCINSIANVSSCSFAQLLQFIQVIHKTDCTVSANCKLVNPSIRFAFYVFFCLKKGKVLSILDLPLSQQFAFNNSKEEKRYNFLFNLISVIQSFLLLLTQPITCVCGLLLYHHINCYSSNQLIITAIMTNPSLIVSQLLVVH